uniref:Uncharacterized protein n=1 Tax=Anguilla anguilla TaxID=7936 RepID=A0A0E9TA33_ANGAN
MHFRYGWCRRAKIRSKNSFFPMLGIYLESATLSDDSDL